MCTDIYIYILVESPSPKVGRDLDLTLWQPWSNTSKYGTDRGSQECEDICGKSIINCPAAPLPLRDSMCLMTNRYRWQ